MVAWELKLLHRQVPLERIMSTANPSLYQAFQPVASWRHNWASRIPTFSKPGSVSLPVDLLIALVANQYVNHNVLNLILCLKLQYFSCMFNGHPSVVQSVDNMKAWSGKQIAPVSNLAARKIYMQVGSADSTVGPNVMAQLKAQLANFDDSANTTFVTTSGASHTFPTDFDGAGDSTCGISLSPYISNCKYDGAGAVLKWLYGSLNPRNAGTATGTTVSYAQTGSYGAQGLGTTGYLYVPESCTGNSSTVCKLHVAMHGCLQSYGQIGSKFITNTGYTMWADTNDIIVLFPQAVVDYTMHTIWSGLQIPNPNGCFDWVGWYGTNADQIGGRLTLMSLAGYD